MLRAVPLPRKGCTAWFSLPLLSCPAQILDKSMCSTRHEAGGPRMGTPGVPAPHPLEPRPLCQGVLSLPQLPWGRLDPAPVGRGCSPFAGGSGDAKPKQMNERPSSAPALCVSQGCSARSSLMWPDGAMSRHGEGCCG